MRKIKSFRLIGFIIALAIIFSSLSVFGSTVAFAAEDSTSYSGEEFVESKEFSNAANGETLQSAFSNKTVRECEYVYRIKFCYVIGVIIYYVAILVVFSRYFIIIITNINISVNRGL